MLVFCWLNKSFLDRTRTSAALLACQWLTLHNHKMYKGSKHLGQDAYKWTIMVCVCVCLCAHASMHVCVYKYACVHLHVCMHVCVWVQITIPTVLVDIKIWISPGRNWNCDLCHQDFNVCVCMHVCMHVCVWVQIKIPTVLVDITIGIPPGRNWNCDLCHQDFNDVCVCMCAYGYKSISLQYW